MDKVVPKNSPSCHIFTYCLLCLFSSFVVSFFLFVRSFGTLTMESIVFSAVAVLPQLVFVCLLSGRIQKQRQVEKDFAELLYFLPEKGNTASEEDAISNSTEASADNILQPNIPDAEKHVLIRSCLVRSVIKELCKSVSGSLSSTTEPISAELLHIRKTGEDFLESIRTYEDEVKNKTERVKLLRESTLFNREMQKLSETVGNAFGILDKKMGDLRTVSNHIGEISADIGEIAAQIRILSFNASIEAARAGAAGRGFRVIAGEIKKLSADTEENLGEINGTLKETKVIFENIGNSIEENRRELLDVVSCRQNGFASFEKSLENYFPKLEILYSGVTSVIASLTKSMDVISPVVQLHEITSQEIGNFSMVADDFCGFVEHEIRDTYPSAMVDPEKEDAETAAADIRKRLTTENELKALERGVKEYIPEAEIDMGINARRIELF